MYKVSILLSSALIVASCESKPPETGTLVIKNVNVVDVRAGQLMAKPKDVLIDGERIRKIIDSGTLKFEESITVQDGQNKFLIPGMWDMHAHPDDPEIWRMNPTDDEKDKLLTLLVMHGVTGIRDMAGDLKLANRWKKSIDNGELIGPEIFAAGPLIDGPNPMWDGSVGINGPDNVRQVVDSLIADGVDFLKVYSLLPEDIYFELQE
ncbi:MAG: hypothetical protein RJQ09_14065 [Cyclobacteriaceae bacterium]